MHCSVMHVGVSSCRSSNHSLRKLPLCPVGCSWLCMSGVQTTFECRRVVGQVESCCLFWWSLLGSQSYIAPYRPIGCGAIGYRVPLVYLISSPACGTSRHFVIRNTPCWYLGCTHILRCIAEWQYVTACVDPCAEASRLAGLLGVNKTDA